MGDMHRKGMFIILPYYLVMDLPHLKVSPIGCVPQRKRRPRMKKDCTFSCINTETLKIAPNKKIQWECTFYCLLWYIFSAYFRHGRVLLSKNELSDGFYQFHLKPLVSLSLKIPFTDPPGEPPLVAIPTRLPMVWTESPQIFSSINNTVEDLINKSLKTSTSMHTSHPLEDIASNPVLLIPSDTNPQPIIDSGPVRTDLAYTDVYNEYFCKLAQGCYNWLRTRLMTFHYANKVFQPNNTLDAA